MKRKILIAPSLLSADFGCLKDEIKKVEKAGADLIHFDIMDGHFVPNLTAGPLIVKPVRKITSLPIDCHLMIEKPLHFIKAFAEAGADIISVHGEVMKNLTELSKVINEIKKLRVKPAIAINPGTPIKTILPLVKEVKMVLLMTVNPGFGGQIFMKEVLPKIKNLKNFIDEKNLQVDIEVDGGINPETAPLVREAGANILVAGSAIFYSKNIPQVIRLIRG